MFTIPLYHIGAGGLYLPVLSMYVKCVSAIIFLKYTLGFSDAQIASRS